MTRNLFTSRSPVAFQKAELLTGYPAEQISEYAAKFIPDLIVLGAKGRRATLGILLGGVVQQIVEYAEDPVLVGEAQAR